MLVKIPQVLTKEQVKECRALLESADWVDGASTTGHLSRSAKKNVQLPQDSQVARNLGDFILSRLGQSQEFLAAGLPCKIFPPMFNCYQGGDQFGFHVDNTIRMVPWHAGENSDGRFNDAVSQRARGV